MTQSQKETQPPSPDIESQQLTALTKAPLFQRTYPLSLPTMSLSDVAMQMFFSLYPTLQSSERSYYRTLATIWHPFSPMSVVISQTPGDFFSTWLQTQHFPSGSEVVVPALAPRHIFSVLQDQSINIRTCNVNMITGGCTLSAVKAAVSAKTQLVVLIPLWGCNVAEYGCMTEWLRKRRILSYIDGSVLPSDVSWMRSIKADLETVSLESGGGVAINVVNNTAVAESVRERLAALPVVPIGMLWSHLLHLALVELISDPWTYGTLSTMCSALGLREQLRRFQDTTASLSASKIGHRPDYSTLRCTVESVSKNWVRERKRRQSTWLVLRQLPPYVQCLAAGDSRTPSSSSFRQFVLLVRNPSACVAIFRANGLEATQSVAPYTTFKNHTCTDTNLIAGHTITVALYHLMNCQKRDSIIQLFHMIPQAVIASPNPAFHRFVQSKPYRHAYHSNEVDCYVLGAGVTSDRPSIFPRFAVSLGVKYLWSKL